MTEQKPEQKTEQKHIPFQTKLFWGSAEKLETIYANHMSITRTENEYYLIFGELAMPVITGPESLPGEIEITPKVRLAIGHIAMKQIIDILKKYVPEDIEE
jgi:hypothetical protein